MGRDLHKIVIVDNSPASYMFHPQNAVSYQCLLDYCIIVHVYDYVLFVTCAKEVIFHLCTRGVQKDRSLT